MSLRQAAIHDAKTHGRAVTRGWGSIDLRVHDATWLLVVVQRLTMRLMRASFSRGASGARRVHSVSSMMRSPSSFSFHSSVSSENLNGTRSEVTD